MSTKKEAQPAVFYIFMVWVMASGLFAFSIPEKLAAQSRLNQGSLEYEVSLQAGLPQGPFRDQLDTIGLGLNMMGGYRLPGLPLMAGLDINFLTFGRDSRSEPLSSTIPDVQVRVDNSYNMVSSFATLRMGGQERRFAPYIEGLAGFNYLYTQSTVHNSIDGEQVFSDINVDDFSFSYGIGAGAQYLIWDGGAIYNSLMYLNLQLRYIRGGQAEYVRPGTIENVDGFLEYEAANSRTDLMYIRLGLSFRI